MKKFLWFKLLSLLADISLGCNLVYQNTVVICNSVQETAIALLVMLLMPLNGCIYASVSDLESTFKAKSQFSPLAMIWFTM